MSIFHEYTKHIDNKDTKLVDNKDTKKITRLWNGEKPLFANTEETSDHWTKKYKNKDKPCETKQKRTYIPQIDYYKIAFFDYVDLLNSQKQPESFLEIIKNLLMTLIGVYKNKKEPPEEAIMGAMTFARELYDYVSYKDIDFVKKSQFKDAIGDNGDAKKLLSVIDDIISNKESTSNVYNQMNDMIGKAYTEHKSTKITDKYGVNKPSNNHITFVDGMKSAVKQRALKLK